MGYHLKEAPVTLAPFLTSISAKVIALLSTINFTDMDKDEFHNCLLGANTKLLENYFQKKLSATVESAKRLYLQGHADFRGFRQI